jgi:hypothetical protein
LKSLQIIGMGNIHAIQNEVFILKIISPSSMPHAMDIQRIG